MIPLDFLVCVNFKNKVYIKISQTIYERKANIRDGIVNIMSEMYEILMENVDKRIHFVMTNRGDSLIEVVFK